MSRVTVCLLLLLCYREVDMEDPAVKIDKKYHLVSEAYGVARGLFARGHAGYERLRRSALLAVDTLLDLARVMNGETAKQLRAAVVKFYRIKYFHDFANYVITLEEMIDIVEHCLAGPVQKLEQLRGDFHSLVRNFRDVRRFDAAHKCRRELPDEVAAAHCVLHQAVLFNETMQESLVSIVEIKTRQHARKMNASLHEVHQCLDSFVPNFFEQLLVDAYTEKCGFLKVVNASIVDLINGKWRDSNETLFPKKWSPLVEILKQKYDRFPRDEIRKKKWTDMVRKERKDDTWEPSKYSVICSNHFKNEDFYITAKGKRYLHKKAWPILQFHRAPPSPQTSAVDRSATPLIDVDDEEIEEVLLTPRKFKLKTKLKIMEERLKKSQNITKSLRTKCKRAKKKIITLKLLLAELKKKGLTQEDLHSKLSDYLEAGEIFKQMVSKKNPNLKSRKYSPNIRKFALALNFYSPTAYKYARRTFASCLPHPRTLNKWYETINCDPGFTSEAFKMLKSKAGDNVLLCNLVFDEMAIRQQEIWDGKKIIGTVDDCCGSQENSEIATQAIVFMLVSYTEKWKLPVGYFFINSLSAEQKVNLIQICLKKCHDCNVKVVSITFDGTATNMNAAKLLGCNLNPKNLKVSFPHPATGENIVIFPDPCHMIKLIRNSFQSSFVIYNEKGDQLKWEYLIKLQNLQNQEHLNFGNKLTAKHIHYKNQIMKVRLATQLFSKSIGDTLNFCETQMKIEDFRGCSPTADFLYIVNTLFDILNSRTGQKDFKEPLSSQNQNSIFEFCEIAKAYFSTLTTTHYKKFTTKNKTGPYKIKIKKFRKPLIESKKKTGFLGMVICIESVKILYQNLVASSIIKEIPFYCLSQDHLELYFSTIRQHGGSNNNPNAVQFKGIYRKTLQHLELVSNFNMNCIPLQNITILAPQSSVLTINASSDRLQINQNENMLTEDVESDDNPETYNCLELLTMTLNRNYSLSESVKQIVGYLSGWVVRKLTKAIKCEKCLKSTMATEKLFFHKLITFKNKGGLIFPSFDVFTVCRKVEMVIRNLEKECGGSVSLKKYPIDSIKNMVLREFINTTTFDSLIAHSFEQPLIYNHRVHLIRAIIDKYVNLRLHYITKTLSLKVTKRQKFNKLVLFEGL